MIDRLHALSASLAPPVSARIDIGTVSLLNSSNREKLENEGSNQAIQGKYTHLCVRETADLRQFLSQNPAFPVIRHNRAFNRP